MGKTEKIDEYALGTPPYKQRKRKISRKISKNIRTRKQIIDEGHYTLQPMAYGDRISEREKAIQQKNIDEPIIGNCTHDESISDTNGYIVCRFCGVRLKQKKNRKEIFLNLFCVHRETKEFDEEHIMCTKCGAKFKKNRIMVY